jgi:hypothetical protein
MNRLKIAVGLIAVVRALSCNVRASDSYVVLAATPSQEVLLRAQVQAMHPDVLPSRIVFVPHWKYLDNARIMHLHLPTGYTSVMFTHLPSRTVFIDNGRYVDGGWLGYWMAHELGHLVTNSVREEDAEKAASKFRKRLKDATRLDDRLESYFAGGATGQFPSKGGQFGAIASWSGYIIAL